MIFIYMMVASVVLFENFSASYTSFLSVVTQAKPFETIAGLEQTSFTIGAQAGTAYRTMFTVGGVGGQGPHYSCLLSATPGRADGKTCQRREGRGKV